VIAGHIFGTDGKCGCGKRLCDISFAAYGQEWINQTGIAHSGSLIEREQVEIALACEAIFGHVVGCATGGSVPLPQQVYPLFDDSRMEPDVA
jgi:hypothetical protein